MTFTLSAFETEIIGKLLLATSLGLLIGLERESDGSPAGLKTHTIVCLSSALFTIGAFTTGFPMIAGGVLTGIGFIGAGAIFRFENRVNGLTTADGLWTVAAIGFAVGIGLFFASIATTVLLLVILVPLEKIKKRYLKNILKIKK